MRTPKSTVSFIIGAVGLVTTIGGGIYALGDRPPWAGVERVAQLEQNNQRTRYSQVLADISRLLDTQRRRSLSNDEKRWLSSLQVERRQLACQLRLEAC